MAHIIFVCTGNTCRSPMAEALAKAYFRKNEITEHTVSSRGLSVSVPSKAAQNAIMALKVNYDINLSRHIARGLTIDDINAADIIITMTKAQKLYITSAYHAFENKIKTLAEVSDGVKGDIPDPYEYDIDVYENCAAVIKKCVESIRL